MDMLHYSAYGKIGTTPTQCGFIAYVVAGVFSSRKVRMPFRFLAPIVVVIGRVSNVARRDLSVKFIIGECHSQSSRSS